MSNELPHLVEGAIRVIDDMNPEQCMDLFHQDDGDLIITVWNKIRGSYEYCTIELCTGPGGGKELELKMLLSKFVHRRQGPGNDDLDLGDMRERIFQAIDSRLEIYERGSVQHIGGVSSATVEVMKIVKEVLNGRAL